MSLFDYVFYRVAKFYTRWNYGIRTCSLITIACFFCYFDALILSPLFYVCKIDPLKVKILSSFSLLDLMIAALIIVGLSVNLSKRYERLLKQYEGESHSRLKGWLVFIFCVASIAALWLSSWLFNVK